MAVPDLEFRHQLDTRTVNLGRSLDSGRSLSRDDLILSSSLIPLQDSRPVHTQSQFTPTHLQHFEAVPGGSPTGNIPEDRGQAQFTVQQHSFIPRHSFQPHQVLHLNPRGVPFQDLRHQQGIHPPVKENFIFTPNKFASASIHTLASGKSIRPPPSISIISNHQHQVKYLRYPREFYQTKFLSRPVMNDVHHKQNLLFNQNFTVKRTNSLYPQNEIKIDQPTCRYQGFSGISCTY